MIQLKQFEAVGNYCEDISCRHKAIAKAFGETTDKCGSRCDACCKPIQLRFYKIIIRVKTIFKNFLSSRKSSWTGNWIVLGALELEIGLEPWWRSKTRKTDLPDSTKIFMEVAVKVKWTFLYQFYVHSKAQRDTVLKFTQTKKTSRLTLLRTNLPVLLPLSWPNLVDEKRDR